jgi:hypothetical protein
MGRGAKPGQRRGGRRKGTRNRVTKALGTTLTEAAKALDAEALNTLDEIMSDRTATATARIRCAELILERGHGKPAPWQEPGPEVAPLAERIAWYTKRDEFEAGAGNCGILKSYFSGVDAMWRVVTRHRDVSCLQRAGSGERRPEARRRSRCRCTLMWLLPLARLFDHERAVSRP